MYYISVSGGVPARGPHLHRRECARHGAEHERLCPFQVLSNDTTHNNDSDSTSANGTHDMFNATADIPLVRESARVVSAPPRASGRSTTISNTDPL